MGVERNTTKMKNHNETEKDTILNLSKKDILDMIHESANTKARYSDTIIEHMVNALTFTSVSVEVCRTSKWGTFFNRGSMVECLLKIALNGYRKAHKTVAVSDIRRANGKARNIRRGFEINPDLNYEVKFNTSYALASDNAPKSKYVLKVLKEGVYLVLASEYERNTKPQGEKLDELSDYLGF
jgi:hypothetical protein